MPTDRELEMSKAIADAEAADDEERDDDSYARPKPPRRRAGDVYTFRLPSERREQLRRAAESRGVAPATLIRDWIEAQLDGDAHRSAAAQAVADLSSHLPALGSMDLFAGNHGARLLFKEMDPIDIVPKFDVAPFQRAFSDLIESAGLVPSVAAATEGLHRALSAALVELDVVKEELVAAVSEAQSGTTRAERLSVARGERTKG